MKEINKLSCRHSFTGTLLELAREDKDIVAGIIEVMAFPKENQVTINYVRMF